MKPWTHEELEGRILFENEGLLAVNKCPDLPTTGRSLDDSDCLQWQLIQRHGSMVWSAHQLDADTSGVCLFTTARELVEPIKLAMSGPGSAKVYRAFARGHPDWHQRVCDAPIGYVDERNLGVTPRGKAARTQIKVVGRFPPPKPASQARTGATESSLEEGASEWLVRLETGRTHQIRIHASHLGHPLLGEEWYRSPPCTVHPRQALHAETLQLGAPFEREILAPLPEDLKELRARLADSYLTSS